MNRTPSQIMNSLLAAALQSGALEMELTHVGARLVTKPSGLGIKTTVSNIVFHKDTANG